MKHFRKIMALLLVFFMLCTNVSALSSFSVNDDTYISASGSTLIIDDLPSDYAYYWPQLKGDTGKTCYNEVHKASETIEIDTSDCESGTYELIIFRGQSMSNLFSTYGAEEIKVQISNGQVSLEEPHALRKNQSMMNSLSVDPEDYTTPSTDYFEDIASKIAKGSSVRSKAESINTWLFENISYDYSFSYPADSTSVYETGLAVCEGYANLGVDLLRTVGIPAIKVHGWALGAGTDNWSDGNTNHAWIIYYANGDWYNMDPTWDSTAETGGTWFNSTLEFMSYSHQMERFILDKNSNNNKPSKIEVEDASFTEYVDEMNVGDYMRLGFEINPSNAEYSNVEIKSTNTGAIQVSGTKITAVAPGTATIMLYVDGKLYDQMKIVVPSDSTGGSTGGSSGGSTGGSDTDELEYAYFDDYQDTLFVGDTATLSYDIKPTSFLADVELESSDEDVIRVVSNYKYKAVGEGSAMLSLYVDGSLQDMILITVESDDYGEEEEELEHASISKYESELEVGQTAYAILDIEPKSYANQARLESSNERVIKISGNKYEAVGAGEAKITLYIGADRYDIIKVTVKGNGKEENTGTYDVTNIDEAYYQAIDFSPFTNEQLNVYKNSRVTGLKANGSSYSIDGYTFINGVNCASASTLWRELVLIDVNNPDVAHSYRMNLYGVKKGGFLTANKNINPTGRLNYSYATYNANFNKNSFKSYDKTRAGVPAGTYMLYVRVSDGKNGKMFPVQNLTLSDGSKTQLPSGFGMISSYDNVYWEVK